MSNNVELNNFFEKTLYNKNANMKTLVDYELKHNNQEFDKYNSTMTDRQHKYFNEGYNMLTSKEKKI